jgi:hypothetical protein
MVSSRCCTVKVFHSLGLCSAPTLTHFHLSHLPLSKKSFWQSQFAQLLLARIFHENATASAFPVATRPERHDLSSSTSLVDRSCRSEAEIPPSGLRVSERTTIKWNHFPTFRKFPASLSERSGDPALAGLQGASIAVARPRNWEPACGTERSAASAKRMGVPPGNHRVSVPRRT